MFSPPCKLQIEPYPSDSIPQTIIPPPSKQSPSQVLRNSCTLPFLISQLCGLFPFSVKMSPNGSKTLEPSKWNSVPMLVCVSLLTFSMYHVASIITGLAWNPYSSWWDGFSYTGRNTILAVNIFWGICSIICPIIIRINLLKNRKGFLKLWEDFCNLLEKLDKLNIPPENAFQFSRTLRRNILFHVISFFAINLLGIALFLDYMTKLDARLKGGEILTVLPSIIMSFVAVLQYFSLTVLLYFLQVYHFCINELVSCLQNLTQYKSLKSFKLNQFVQFYRSLDEHVEEFNSHFSLRMNLEIYYGFGCILYHSYYIVFTFQVYNIMSVLIVMFQLVVFITYFYWLTSTATSLQMKSALFKKYLGYLNHDLIDTNSVVIPFNRSCLQVRNLFDVW